MNELEGGSTGAAADHIATCEAAHSLMPKQPGDCAPLKPQRRIVAATDFNFSYLSNSAEIGLLAESLILVGAGIAAGRLRRRIGRRDDQQTEEPGPGAAEPLPAAPR